MSDSQFESIISQIISDTPSGEIKQVYEDLITIAGENSKETVLDAIEQYNIKNLIPIEVDGKSVVLSRYNREGSKFFDPASSISFNVDHLNREGFDIQPFQSTQLNQVQEDLLKNLQKYAEKNFPGYLTTSIYPIPEESNKIVLSIVSMKYNPSNFWNGHWRSEYIFDSNFNKLKGSIDVQVHYYEDGNVSFKSSETFDLDDITDVIKTIAVKEKEFEENLDTSFSQLNETQFKSLRRRLPITRSRVNWGKAIGTYRLGKDAAQGK
ncbi:hypothetical protein HG535_0D03670 [Zygotorulaspora mrakii]|uniref:F-actin-capping protein subunit alpha n=1 Tax=Zygotorulaspora mrakii TaxID=42260 RepID=A0A7H9B3Z7_ZYGMR|nr:uncharacterized protein HG535_0D03670 [Zygotorulaspora mrakii]QLG72659.1 hypothetical protein HG535_0D03670 [Zygotorulaspora mrakii]